MDIQEYLGKYKEIQNKVLEFIEDDEFNEESFKKLISLFIEKKISNDKHDLQLLLHLISKIRDNHNRNPSFYEKIEKIIKFFEEDIKKYFTNHQAFNIFKGNKRILLFLIEEDIIYFDEYIIKTITNGKYEKKNYPRYFYPEMEPFIYEKWFPKYDNKELPEDFYEKRKIGENDQ